MATVSNLYIDAGSDFITNITVSTATGFILDLTGYTAKSQIRKSFSTSTAYDFVTTIPTPTSGTVRLQLSNIASEAIPPGRYLYDVEITQTSSGIKTRIIEGIATINPQITKI